MTTALVNHEQTHQSYLVEHLLGFRRLEHERRRSAITRTRCRSTYLPQMITGQKQGLGMIYGMIQAQAAMLSFNDIYRVLMFMMIILVPSFLLLRRPDTSGGS